MLPTAPATPRPALRGSMLKMASARRMSGLHGALPPGATTATEKWSATTGTYEPCIATACDAAFGLELGACLPRYLACNVPNATSSTASTWSPGAVQLRDSCAVLSNGRVVCWRSNYNRTILGSTDDILLSPFEIVGVSDAIQVSQRGSHMCVLHSNGTVSCWGDNSYGQLGDGSTTASDVPVLVPGLTGVVEIGVGSSFSCARLASGSVKCWGANNSNQLGDGSTTTRTTPVFVSGVSWRRTAHCFVVAQLRASEWRVRSLLGLKHLRFSRRWFYDQPNHVGRCVGIIGHYQH